MVGRAFQTKEPWNTFPQVHPSPQHPWQARARARAAADRRGKQSEGTQ